MEQLRVRSKRALTLLLALIMLLSVPLEAFAEAKINHEEIADDKAKFVNTLTPVQIARPGQGETAENFVKNPAQPAIYTLRKDYKVQKGEKYEINYQPYIASVGEAATEEEKAKVNKVITLPDLAGYDKSKLDDSYTIKYDTVKNAANGEGKTGNEANGLRYFEEQDFKYKAKSNDIKIKHLFQDMSDFTKYTNPGGDDQPEKITTQNGNTGSTMEVSPLNEVDRRGFIPEAAYITMQVPEDATDFVLEYRYNRAHYNVDFDTMGGTPIATRTYYYNQEIPKIEKENIPTKIGCEFQGWKPSHDLQTTDGKTYKKDQIINKADGKPALDLDVHLKMPALLLGKDEKSRERLKFTAVWKDKEKADYAIQFWVEKADHADNASLLDKYDYMGTRVHKDADTGFKPDLDNEPVKDIVFPDLDQARLQKIWNGDLFYARQYLYLNKFFVYNKDLTHDENKDLNNPSVVKAVSATGKTVYNIYYDRQVYDLYFTKSNALGESETFYPSIYVPDGEGGAKLAGEPGKPYHYTARFNQLMLGWPNDAMQTKGFDEGKQSYGWGPNYGIPQWPLHLDTPPYRLNADEFLDMSGYDNKGGYVSQIDKGDGSTIDVNNDPRYKDEPYKALSFGIKQEDGSMPHHMDFWMDGFKPKETIIRYDLYRSKADTNSPTYGHRYSRVQGFTPYGYTPGGNWPAIEEGSEEHGRITEDDIDTLNEERGEITPYPDKDYTDTFGFNNALGQIVYRKAFFNNADPFGDALDGEAFETNGYIRFKYKRNKYPLRFNYDPSVIKDDSEFNEKNSLDTFYEFPLKVLNPKLVPDDTPREEREYFKDNPKNLLDEPENLQKLGLTDLVFTDKDGKLKVKRPDGLSDQMVFKGWALDPAGTKLVWENPKETMPNHPLNLYAKWGEPDYKWKVTFDPDGGKLKTIKEEGLTTERKKIQEGDIGQEEVNTYAKKEANEGDKQVFTVIQRQKLVEPVKPEKKGYDFMGWEVVRYKKNDKGDYTNEIDDSYRKTYGVPELYTFGNDVVGPIYLKAIWVPNQRVDVKVTHHFLDKDCKKDGDPLVEFLENKRTGYYTSTTGDKQGEKWILAPNDELINSQDQEIKDLYKKYNDNFGFNNTYFQNQRIEPEKIKDPNTGELIPNINYHGNEFHFFYRPFRQREYTVNYIDERGKAEVEKFFKKLELIDTNGLKDDELIEANEANKKKFEAKKSELDEILKKYKVVGPEAVTNGNRHYDARNYRPIPGWKLVSAPQQQLFFDLNEGTNEFLGINSTGSDQIFFYYKDVRVIEVPKDDPVPDGYVRVTFKADKGGSFGKDAQGNPITELNYDVIKGLKSDLLPVPKELAEGETADANKNYITPDDGKKFIKWDEKPLLNKNTIIENDKKDFYVFTAKFEWSGLSATGLVRTEAFKDPNNTWTNDFAPKIEDLKKQLVWKEKDVEKPLPEGTKIQFFDEKGTELTTDDQVFELVNEKKAADKDELVHTVNVKAKVTFKDGKEPQELTIPITVYKNVYEALNKEGDKPLFLKEAEGKDSKNGGLKDVTGEYVMVTIKASKDFNAKDDKIYYVNKNAWVEIPEVKTEGSSTFVNWKADKDAQNDDGKKDGIFDFGKRHKFTENTVITPGFSNDVVPQEGEDKPKVPDNFVKVIVKSTDKATEEVEKTFWVNPTKEVAIDVTNPTGKNDQEVEISGLGKKKVNYVFKEWQKVQAGEADDSLTKVDPAVKIDLANHKYTDKVTVIEAAYKKSIQPGKIEEPLKTTKLDTPQGKEITDDVLIKQITPQEGKKIDSIEVISKPDPSNPGKTEAKVIVKYKDGSTQGTDKDPVIIPVEVHKNIIPEAPGGQRPKDALKNYVKVIFKAGTGGSLSGDLVYYVSPEVEVDMTASSVAITKTASVGYFVNGENWTNKDKKTLKGTFTDAETEFVFNFTKRDDVIPEKNDDGTTNNKPDGYVTVTLIPTDKATDTANKVFFVNPKAKNVTIANKPEGKKETIDGIEYTYVFNGWKVTKGTVASWTDENIKGQFTQYTEITAEYSRKVGIGDLIHAPVAKKDVVTPIKEEPKPEDLIDNKTGLPTGTIFTYTNDGKPNLDNPGKTTAKVEVKYPNGKTVVVEVPITVVDNVVPQIGGENGQKPLVPEDYVKVTVDTTDKATDNTKFTKVFWVKPNVEVTIPGILDPTGKPETENGVTKTNNFKKWKLVGSNPEKFYDTKIKDTFIAKESTIVATYEEGKNVEPKAKNDQWIPQGSKPNAKDFINNPYDDSDPNNKDNLPPGTRFEFVGENPDTQTPGTGKETKIKVIYPNGEVKEVPVRYNVTGDVVEQPDPNYPNTKPAVPDNFVKVIVKTTEKATDDITRVFWVNPEKEVTIPVTDPIGKVVTKLDETVDYTWKFTGWDIKLTQQFEKETTITAQYKKDFGGLTPWHPIPEARGGFIYTDLGKQVTNEEYKSQIQLPAGYSFNTGTTFEIVSGTEPNINKTGLYSVKAWVTYPDGSGQEVTILVYVGEARVVPQPLPQPGGTGYNAIYIEKKVEVPAKIKPLHKEVRYMQGFNGYFRPEDGLTRAEAAQILANALVEDGYNYNPNYKISYPDIGNEWYTKAIKITTEANVFAGYDDGLFRPEKKITRAEWVATLRRFQNIAEADGNHMNLSGNHWAKAEIEGAFNEGWLKIYSDGLAKFKADEFIPRQEVAAVSNRAFNRVFDKTYIIRNDKAFINQYKDVNPSMWAYEDILCASNTFVHDEQLYRAHDVKNDKITFNVNLDELEILQDKFQRNPR